jgi:excisionase family DNA binding protein
MPSDNHICRACQALSQIKALLERGDEKQALILAKMICELPLDLSRPEPTSRVEPPEPASSDTEPKLLRVTEVGTVLGMTKSRIYELIASGTLPSIRIGRSIRVPRAALYDWIASNMN